MLLDCNTFHHVLIFGQTIHTDTRRVNVPYDLDLAGTAVIVSLGGQERTVIWTAMTVCPARV